MFLFLFSFRSCSCYASTSVVVPPVVPADNVAASEILKSIF
ncbi:MAG TPA: hypothetical protein VJ767_06945 [Nitrososphaeraceae archaeon]|nr:hypothetical protein [Nitrososphaeraceae archaeon]